MKRLTFVALGAAAALAGCKEPNGPAVDPAVGGIRAGTDIVIHGLRERSANDDMTTSSTDIYYIVDFQFTNDLGYALAPRIDHFVISDRQQRRYIGLDTGSSALVGISNYEGILQRDEKHDYTVGFRVPLDTQGQLVYDPSY